MNKLGKKLLAIVLVFSFAFVALNSANALNAQGSNNLVRKIVVFDKNISDKGIKTGILKKAGAQELDDLALVNSISVMMPEKAISALEKMAGIRSVEEDAMFYTLARPDTECGNGACEPGENVNKCPQDCSGDDEDPEPPQEPSQVVPWGYNRIYTVEANQVNRGTGIRVGIIDTGISTSHPDLAVKGGINTINTRKSYNDDNGHGSHVAGTVAALDNNIGVIGVAPEAELYAIKVLDRRGVGYLSDIIEGLEWSINNGMQVVNMSLGRLGITYVNGVDIYEEAINAVYNEGITIVAAAGNDGDGIDSNHEIYYPARYTNTIAVSATDDTDNLAWFSSWGEGIDIAAPGQDIISTYKGDGYAIGSGTSMATPHVVGVVALILNSDITGYDFDGDGEWDPNEVKQKLQDGAEDIGLSEDKQGAGLADARSGI
jgi:subtilisin